MSRLDDWEDKFADASPFYPGSSKKRQAKPVVEPTEEPTWADHPKRYKIGGVERDFFGTGDLAQALGREAVTIRRWEREGFLPKATFRVPHQDPRGTRRLYSREQVEGIVSIAAEVGLLDSTQIALAKTDFTDRVIALFKELGRKA